MFELLLLVGIFTSLLAGQFARIEFINGLANIYVHEFLLLIFLIYCALQFGFAPLKRLFKSKAVLSFILILFFSFFLSLREFTFMQNGVAFLYLARMILYVLFAVYLSALMKRKKYIKNFILKFLIIFSVLLLVITAIQYIFFPNFWNLYALGWDPHLYRASAIYFDVFIAAAVYGSFAFFWYSRKQKVMAFLFVIALALTFSRSAYVAFAISVSYVFITQKKWKELCAIFCVFVALIVLIPKPFGEGVNLLRTSSINSRILDYKLGIALWQKKPLFGFGYNRIRFAKEQSNLVPADDRSHSLSSFHSSFLIILVTTGIMGFIFFAILVGLFFKKYPAMRIYVIYILCMSLFDNVLLHVLVLLPLLFLATQLAHSSLE